MKTYKPSIIFFGTPDFAVPTLQALIREDYDVILVVTQAAKPVGRKQILTSTPVKIEAKKLSLPVGTDLAELKKYHADLGVVAAYGELIPKKILDLFPLGVLNIHPSLLPKYRGPSPIQTAILNGDKETGITIIKLDAKMDHGEKLKAQSLKLKADDGYKSLSESLALLGAKMLVEILPDYLNDKIKLLPQDDSQATFTKIISKEDGKINWQKSAEQIERQIRAYAPWPGCYAEFMVNGKKINVKIVFARVCDNVTTHNCASLHGDNQENIGKFTSKDNFLYIRCGHGALLVETLQPEGKKEMSAREFINGYLR
ncbi:MAG: methionyl-tRNA formyltransferase [Candidatus Komeilibacteria bacterium]|nr:methionyl-tRNA formyltransferase [Candidatus Komeilibacteria bacterium]